MNIHLKLLKALIKTFQIYLDENGYDYEDLPDYDKTCFTKLQFQEMLDLSNSEL